MYDALRGSIYDIRTKVEKAEGVYCNKILQRMQMANTLVIFGPSFLVLVQTSVRSANVPIFELTSIRAEN